MIVHNTLSACGISRFRRSTNAMINRANGIIAANRITKNSKLDMINAMLLMGMVLGFVILSDTNLSK